MTHKLANKNYDLQAMPTWPIQIMHTSRAETGPMSFGDDWPGVFIRGDNALMYATNLRLLMHELPEDKFLKDVLTGLHDLLRSCCVD